MAPTATKAVNPLTKKPKRVGTPSPTSPTTAWAATALRRQVADSPHRKATRPLTTLGGEEPLKGLELMVMDSGEYAPKARIAGALSALVHLGYPVIAMRTLGATWEEEAVDPATACWLVSEVFSTGSPSSQIEAAQLLRHYASTLAYDGSTGSAFEWPHALYAQWPKDLPRDARLDCIFAGVELMLSRDRSWWGGIPSMVTTGLLDEAFENDPDEFVRECSGQLLKTMLALEKGGNFTWGAGHKNVDEIRKRVSAYEFGLFWPVLQDLSSKIEAWGESSAEAGGKKADERGSGVAAVSDDVDHAPAEGGRRPPAGRP